MQASAEWEFHAGYRCRPLGIRPSSGTGFSDISTTESHVVFTNVLSDQLLARDSTLLSGSGVALGDIDGDGRCDIYFCSLAGRNRLYRNLGNWQFEEVTEQSGAACPGQISRGAVFADVDGDRALDLLVTAKGGGTRLFLNNGKGLFHEATAQWGLATNTGSTSLALADVDGNGSLDLYVANFGTEMILREGGGVATRIVNGRMVVTGRYAKKVRIINNQFVEFGEPHVLYLNDGKGRFSPVPWEKGAFLDEQGKPVETPWDFGLAVQMRDFNGDGWPDIYVCNDFYTPDRIWINNSHGRFRAIDSTAIRKTSYASMAVDFADIDRDGNTDAFVIEMLARDPAVQMREMNMDFPTRHVIGGVESRPQTGRNTLQHSRGDGTFAEIAHYGGVAASDWSWTAAFLDVDLDGYEDLLVGNGPTYDLIDLDTPFMTKGRDARSAGHPAKSFPRLEVPNCAFRNNGNLTFSECGRLWGFDSLRASTAMALADLDGDGDLDVVVNCLNAAALLLRNESSAPRVAVRLKGAPPNTQGIGALVTVKHGAVPSQSQEVISGGRYLSGDDPVRVFGAGSLTNIVTIEVAWRSGKHSAISNAAPNRIYEIEEPATVASKSERVTISESLFEDASGVLGHSHYEEPFDDFELQLLLPKRLSQLGPGVAWIDLDGDGREELVVGSGRNGQLAAYRWDGKSRFQPVAAAGRFTLSGDSAGMSAGVVSGRRALLVGQSNYELSGQPLAPLWSVAFGTNDGVLQTRAEGLVMDGSSVGPIAAADLDGDGELEVFVGGRVLPGRYPEEASSFILHADKAGLKLDAKLSEPFKKLGLVSGAVFSDLDGDGRPELILACEWGPIRGFRFGGDSPREVTAELGLGEYTGWWQSVTTGDLDGDGRMDIVAGNWGLNSCYRAEPEHPLVLYHGDFRGDGGVQLLETRYDLSRTRLLCARYWKDVCTSMPFVLQRYTNYTSFSAAKAEDVLGDKLPRARRLAVSTLKSMVFFNRGHRFEAAPLPAEAQWTPIFGISVTDFDGDGLEDVLLAQNFFALPAEAWRQDAGRGLLLKGNGAGSLRPVPGQLSGVRIYGEQRGCAVADYDGDGRLDAVVCQNGEATRVLHNVGAAPGLRIRLRGGAGNPDGVGSIVRLGSGDRLGPAREIHAGSGYYSQDSAVQVMSPLGADRLLVRWPSGKLVTCQLPKTAREVEVWPDGKLQVLR